LGLLHALSRLVKPSFRSFELTVDLGVLSLMQVCVGVAIALRNPTDSWVHFHLQNLVLISIGILSIVKLLVSLGENPLNGFELELAHELALRLLDRLRGCSLRMLILLTPICFLGLRLLLDVWARQQMDQRLMVR
jgi:hypothetical protein